MSDLAFVGLAVGGGVAALFVLPWIAILLVRYYEWVFDRWSQ